MMGYVFEFMTFKGLIMPATQFQGTVVGIFKREVKFCELAFEKTEIESGVVGD